MHYFNVSVSHVCEYVYGLLAILQGEKKCQTTIIIYFYIPCWLTKDNLYIYEMYCCFYKLMIICPFENQC